MFCLQEALCLPCSCFMKVLSGISVRSASVLPLESDAHMEAFNECLLVGCKLHDSKTQFVFFSGALSTSCDTWPRKVAGSCAVNTELTCFPYPPAEGTMAAEVMMMELANLPGKKWWLQVTGNLFSDYLHQERVLVYITTWTGVPADLSPDAH